MIIDDMAPYRSPATSVYNTRDIGRPLAQFTAGVKRGRGCDSANGGVTIYAGRSTPNLSRTRIRRAA
jgi:hypothetical protein